MRGFCLQSGAALEAGDGDAGLAPLRRILLESSPATNMADETHRLATFEARAPVVPPSSKP